MYSQLWRFFIFLAPSAHMSKFIHMSVSLNNFLILKMFIDDFDMRIFAIRFIRLLIFIFCFLNLNICSSIWKPQFCFLSLYYVTCLQGCKYAIALHFSSVIILLSHTGRNMHQFPRLHYCSASFPAYPHIIISAKFTVSSAISLTSRHRNWLYSQFCFTTNTSRSCSLIA